MIPECLKLTRYFFPPHERSDAVVAEQLVAAEKRLKLLVTKELAPHQRIALLCLLSDVEAGLVGPAKKKPLENTFLIRALNKGMYQIAGTEFLTFCYANWKFNERAYQKRRAELHLYVTGKMLF